MTEAPAPEPTMPGNPIKFRCYKCNQLLGVTRSKIGTVVMCPRCATELLVPEPEEAPASASTSSSPAPSQIPETTADFLSALSAGLPEEIADIQPEDIRVEIELDADPAPIPAPEPLPPLVLPEPDPVPAPAFEPAVPTNSVRPSAPVEPIVAAINLAPPSLVSERTPVVRSRDLVLPRSVVASWSLFVLLALILAFLAGLLAGHYVWRVH